MNKKIGLFICYNYHDYGSMLQAYATQKYFDISGVPSETVQISDKISDDIRKRKIKYYIRNAWDISVLKEKTGIVHKYLHKKINVDFNNKLNRRASCFNVFCEANFHLSKKYESWNDLRNGCKEYSAVVVGSDQLWLPSNIVADYYTLSIVPDDINKVAYATSFGVSHVPNYLKAEYVYFLTRFQHLSAREISGQRIIEESTGKNVPLVCDPTFLLGVDEWNKIISEKNIYSDFKYIFCYFMGDNPKAREFAQSLKQKYNYKIIALLHLDKYIKNDESYADITPYDVGPHEFISLIKNAEFVCTDSFHGTVFSILYHKKFFTFLRHHNGETLGTNTRITSLLQILRLKDRIMTNNVISNTEIDYKQTDSLLNNFVNGSKKYIYNALGIKMQ